MEKHSVEIYSKSNDAWSSMEAIAFKSNPERPFYICNINDIIHKYKVWKEVMPVVKPFYAVKCNNNPVVLKVLAALGIGFDCASKSEIEQVLSLGVNPERIVFAHPTKPNYHIAYASNAKVKMMTFDSELELYKIKEVHENPKLIIRIRHDDQNAKTVLGLKFGCNPHTEALQLLQKAKEIGMEVIGVSFHVGSGCRNYSVFDGAISDAKYVFDIAKTIGFNFNLLDIGGGYSGILDDSIKQVAEVVNSALKKYFCDEQIEIISEPGTYFVESAFTLACNVHSIRETTNEDVLNKKISKSYMYYIDDGIFGSFSTVISWDAVMIPTPLKKASTAEKYVSSVWGPTADSYDKIIENILLPKLEYKDWLVFFNMGAYTLSIVTSFNSIDHPEVFHIIDNENCGLLKDEINFKIQH